MKKLLMILLCCLLLTACGPKQPDPATAPTTPPAPDAPSQAPTATPTEMPTETAAVVKFTIYTPNENVDGFNETVIVIDELTAQNVVDELIKEDVLNEGITVNSERLEGSQLFLDFNAAFRDQLLTYGTTGEMMMIGGTVNTFLSAYGAESVTVTVDGEIVESGHVVYDFPIEFME